MPETVTSPNLNGDKPKPRKEGPRAGERRQSSLTQAFDLKDQAYRDARSPDTPVHVRAALMRAWVDLDEVVLTRKGIGKPRPVTARNDPAVQKSRKSPLPPPE